MSKEHSDTEDPLYDKLPQVPYEKSPAEAAKNVPAATDEDVMAMRRKFTEHMNNNIGIEGVPETGSDVSITIPDYDEEVKYLPPPTVRLVEDEFAGGNSKSAIKLAFMGAGQGGGRIAQAFYEMGYRRVAVCNMTSQDMESLLIPSKLVIGNNRGGAGKDPEQGRLAAQESYEDIMDQMMRAFGEGVERIYITVGNGGGCGTGSWPVILDVAREYAKFTNMEKPYNSRLGLIMSLPKNSEGSRVHRNAHASILKALESLEKGDISSLIIVDNAKINDIYPGLPVKQFWTVANRNFASVFHTFNLLAAQDSSFITFDRADFRSVVQNGLMIFGMCRVERWKDRDDVSKAVRQNLEATLLASGFDLSKADTAGAIVLAHDKILSKIPMENIDYAFNSLGRILGNEGITLHSGIYESKGHVTMRVFTIISGLEAPKKRIEELALLAK